MQNPFYLRKRLALASVLITFSAGCLNPPFLSCSEIKPAETSPAKEGNVQKSKSVRVQDEYAPALQALEAYGKKQDFPGMEKKAEEISVQWFNTDEPRYFAWMSAACNVLSSYDFKNDKQFILVEKYARQALQKADKMPVGTETGFVLRLGADEEYLNGKMKGEVWSARRKEKIDIWLHPLKRLEKEIETNYDPTDPKNQGFLNVPPPVYLMNKADTKNRDQAGGSDPTRKPEDIENFVSGMAPEGIKDPKVRAAYEAAIAENQRKMEKNNEQIMLRRIEEHFAPRAEKYITAIYLRPPYNLPELYQKLDEFITNKERKARILNAVTKGMAAAKKDMQTTLPVTTDQTPAKK